MDLNPPKAENSACGHNDTNRPYATQTRAKRGKSPISSEIHEKPGGFRAFPAKPPETGGYPPDGGEIGGYRGKSDMRRSHHDAIR